MAGSRRGSRAHSTEFDTAARRVMLETAPQFRLRVRTPSLKRRSGISMRLYSDFALKVLSLILKSSTFVKDSTDYHAGVNL